LDKEEFERLYREGTAIRKLTVGFIRSMVLTRGGVRTLGKRPTWSNQVWEIYERVTGQPRPEMFVEGNGEVAFPVRKERPTVGYGCERRTEHVGTEYLVRYTKY
jgi:hypothetical protein